MLGFRLVEQMAFKTARCSKVERYDATRLPKTTSGAIWGTGPKSLAFSGKRQNKLPGDVRIVDACEKMFAFREKR
jgi:hypothetical protein